MDQIEGLERFEFVLDLVENRVETSAVFVGYESAVVQVASETGKLRYRRNEGELPSKGMKVE